MEPEFASEDLFFLALWVVVVDISQFPAEGFQNAGPLPLTLRLSGRS